jgi:hypothetical protein
MSDETGSDEHGEGERLGQVVIGTQAPPGEVDERRGDHVHATDGDIGQSEDRPLWHLSRDEQRILLITFAGGLASIVVGAALIGISFALARFEHNLHHPWWQIGILIACPAVLTALLFKWPTVLRSQGVGGLASERWRLVVAVAVFLMWSTLIMWLVGAVAGIH